MIDTNTVAALAEIMRQFGLTRLEARDGEIILEKTPGTIVPVTTAANPFASAATASEPLQYFPEARSGSPVDFNRLTEVRSPIVGVFYIAPSPDSPAFVTVGGQVKKGDILCIIEAMKLMNEIAAEQDGEIVDICLNNGDIAEFGQVLFKMAGDGVITR
ncbi:MAG: acetyl-CoA carboxylase biotin carboxyl carrier protein [Clostridiales bacterium]|jgi:acetyl-CoA carboxylase biotin carboxyl carrier protein|nr:acetyl-CoA carboxylase biotin carboxyl carrier protein [Clostridiales bacterium]